MNYIVLSSLIALNTIAVAEQPSLCNQVQERIVKRVSEIRWYQPEQFLKVCKENTMFFADTKYPFVFAVSKEWETYICKIVKKDELSCIDPKSEEMTYEIFKELYKEWKMEI